MIWKNLKIHKNHHSIDQWLFLQLMNCEMTLNRHFD